MSIASEISRLQAAKADIKAAIEAKGVTVPASAKLDTYDDYVAQIDGGGGAILPYDAEVQYLEFSGAQYIDLGVTVNQDTNFYVECSPTGGSAFKTVLSARQSSSSKRFEVMFGTASNADVEIYFGYNNGSTTIYSGQSLNSQTVSFLKSSGTIAAYNASSYIGGAEKNRAAFTPPVPLRIGATNNNGSVANYFIGKIYKLLLWDYGILTEYRLVKKNGVAAIYDATAGSFYYNSGSGSIIAGPTK